MFLLPSQTFVPPISYHPFPSHSFHSIPSRRHRHRIAIAIAVAVAPLHSYHSSFQITHDDSTIWQLDLSLGREFCLYLWALGRIPFLVLLCFLCFYALCFCALCFCAFIFLCFSVCYILTPLLYIVFCWSMCVACEENNSEYWPFHLWPWLWSRDRAQLASYLVDHILNSRRKRLVTSLKYFIE